VRRQATWSTGSATQGRRPSRPSASPGAGRPGRGGILRTRRATTADRWAARVARGPGPGAPRRGIRDRRARSANRSTAPSPTAPCGRLAARMSCSHPPVVRPRLDRSPATQTVAPLPQTIILLGKRLRTCSELPDPLLDPAKPNRRALMPVRSDTGCGGVGSHQAPSVQHPRPFGRKEHGLDAGRDALSTACPSTPSLSVSDSAWSASPPPQARTLSRPRPPASLLWRAPPVG
jgi:hypothetical protein